MNSVVEAITRRYEEDQRQPRPVVSADQVPASYELITDRWLTAVLCKAVPGARVMSHTLGPKDDGSSNRRRTHLQYNEAGAAAGLPASVFCKAAHALANRIMLALTNVGYNEVNFYNHVRPQLDIAAPRGLFAAYDEAAGTSIIMLEDLGDQVSFCDENTPVDRARVEQQLDLLARLHGAGYSKPHLATLGTGLLTWPQQWERIRDIAPDDPWGRGFAAAGERGLIPPRLLRRGAEVWPRTLDSVASHHALPRTLMHSDVHLKNWYFHNADGRMGLGDWQTLCAGNGFRDVIYVLITAPTIENRRLWETELLRFYLDRLQAYGGPAVAFDQAWMLCRQQMFTVLAFWTMTLTPAASQPDMQPEHTSVVFLQRIAAAMDDHDVLDSF